MTHFAKPIFPRSRSFENIVGSIPSRQPKAQVNNEATAAVEKEIASVTVEVADVDYVSPIRVARDYILDNHVVGFVKNVHYTATEISNRFKIRNSSDVWKLLTTIVNQGVLRKELDATWTGIGRRPFLYFYNDPEQRSVLARETTAVLRPNTSTVAAPVRQNFQTLRGYMYDNAEFFMDNPNCFTVPFVTRATGWSQHHVNSLLNDLANNSLVKADRSRSRTVVFSWTDVGLSVIGVSENEVLEEEPVVVEPPVDHEAIAKAAAQKAYDDYMAQVKS